MTVSEHPGRMDPLTEYSSRRDRRQAAEAVLQRQLIQIGNWRLVIVVGAAGLAWLSFGAHVLSPWLLLVPLAAFKASSVLHQRATRRRTLAARAARYYSRGLDRLEDRWMGHGPVGNQFRQESHVYAEDLDVFGKSSLFQLMSRARTGPGERTLAAWLLSPADRQEAIARQEAVRELRDRLDLREDIALVGEDVESSLHREKKRREKNWPEKLADWGSAASLPISRWLRPLAFGLSLAAAGTFAAFFAHLIPLWPFMAVLGCNFAFRFAVGGRMDGVIGGVETPAHDLRLLSLVLERLERERFVSPRLERLLAQLQVTGRPASKRIKHLGRWMEWLDSSDHLLVKIIGPAVLWQEQCALGVEAWRRENGVQIREWLAAVGDFEALSSLASLTFERPQWTFPILLESGPVFDSKALQHPLLSPAKCVANDVALGGDLRLLIISGSNMSGKSTLLRAAGLNCVLAWAGGPVAASELQVSVLQVGASLRAMDSLQDNRSRFMAEITRLRQIVDLTKQQRPVFFLLDELLSGTNSHDRRIGASAIARSLVEGGAVGFITTHDLALADIEQHVGAQAANAHFEDTIIEGRMEFDYHLRPGIVTRSNALELMRAVGLSV